VTRTAAGLLALVLVQGALLGVDSSAVAGPSGDSAATRAPQAIACKRPAHRFVPTRAQLPSLGRTVRVIQVKRTSSGAVGAAPVTDAGKRVIAMDPRTKPGSRHGSVLLNGHTWPDGSAIGNAMLQNLWKSDGIVLADKDGHRACYVVSKRKSYPVHQVPERNAFRSSGPEQVVIVACSGKRTSPGHWTRRTLWYAKPLTPAPPPPPPSSSPPSAEPDSGVFGGLFGLL
jgi:hypothetical protein